MRGGGSRTNSKSAVSNGSCGRAQNGASETGDWLWRSRVAARTVPVVGERGRPRSRKRPASGVLLEVRPEESRQFLKIPGDIRQLIWFQLMLLFSLHTRASARDASANVCYAACQAGGCVEGRPRDALGLPLRACLAPGRPPPPAY